MNNKSNREHSFDVELACIVGLEKSILLKNIEYWILENERRKQTQYFSNGVWWTEESLRSLADKYPYMKRASIGRWMQELHAIGWINVIISEHGKNKYSMGEVFVLWNKNGDWKALVSQNGTEKDRLKMGHLPSQNGTHTVSKWDETRLKMGHTNIDLNIEDNIELNIADKPHSAPPNEFSKTEIQADESLNENPKKSKNFNGGAAKNSSGCEVVAVVRFLNETVKPACNFRDTSKTTAAHIRQRIADGFTVQDICIIIEHKNSQWGCDPKMREYLRPATLFGTGKFEAYLVAARTWEQGGKKQQIASQPNTTRSTTTNFGADKSKFEQPQSF